MAKQKKDDNLWIGLLLAGVGGFAVWYWRQHRAVEGPPSGLPGGESSGVVDMPGMTVSPGGGARSTEAGRVVQELLNDITQTLLPQAAACAYQVYVRGQSISALRGYDLPVSPSLVKMTPLAEDGIVGPKTRDRYNWLRNFCQAFGQPLSPRSTDAPEVLVPVLEQLANDLQGALEDLVMEGQGQTALIRAGANWLVLMCRCQTTSEGTRMTCPFAQV